MQSPHTYFRYRANVWWGKQVRIEIVAVSTRGRFALAKVHVAAGPPIFRSQWALVERRANAWKVVAVALDRAQIACSSAPRDVLRHLAGGCSGFKLSPVGVVSGPRAVRAPTAVERAALVAAARTAIFNGHDRCVQYHVSVSSLDQRYASIRYTFEKPYTDCLLGNGDSVFRRTSGGWRDDGAASDGFPCTYLPPGVVRSLFGACLIP